MRLANAKELFGNERKELEETLHFVVESMMGYEIIEWDDGPGLRLKVKIDDRRFFIIQIAHHGEKKQSK